MKWAPATIFDLCHLQRGYDISKAEQTEGAYPVISSGGAASTHSEFKAEGPGVIIGRKGSLGTVYYTEKNYWPHSTVLWVKDFRNNHPKFVFYFLKTLKLERLDAGAANPSLNRNHVHPLKIRIPDLAGQNQIASILAAYDDLIENNRRRMALLEESARHLYREWFVRLRFPGHESTPVRNCVPEGWERKPLGECVVTNKTSIKKGFVGLIRYVDISSVSPGSIDDIKELDFSEAPSRARRVVSDGDIIWSCVRPNHRSHAVISDPRENLIVSTGFVVITPTGLPTSYVYCATTTNEFVAHLMNRAMGVAYPAVKPKDFEEALIFHPEESILNRFDEMVKPMQREVHILDKQNTLLAEARDHLLPRLMSGEIDV